MKERARTVAARFTAAFFGAAFAAAFFEADFFAAALRPVAVLAMSVSPDRNELSFPFIIRAFPPLVQEGLTKLIADGLPVRATTPMADSAPVPGLIINPVMSSLS